MRTSNNIVDEISRYTELRRTGDRLMGLCPFPDHNEKTPSFSVNENLQVYFCFGCKKSGTIFRFIQEMQGLTFPETVKLLAHRAGLEIPKDENFNSDAEEKKAKKVAYLKKINLLAAKYFQTQLQSLKPDDVRHRYLVKRSLTPSVIKNFSVGLCHDSWEGLTNEFVKRKVPLDLANELGLVKKGKSGKYYDAFRNRLVFPIYSLTGDCLGFGGRTLGDDPAKYLNSPESELFHKGRVLYGLNESAKFIRSSDHVVIVEGYMDCIALFQAGIKNVVAVLGTALTESHVKLLKRFTKNIVVLFDGDSSGIQASERSLPILLKGGVYPKGVFLPDKMDPDDFIRQKGVESLQSLISSAPDLFSLFLGRKMKNYSGQSSEKVKIMDELAPILGQIEDPRLLNLYIQEISHALGQKVSWVSGALKLNRPSQPAKLTQSMARDVKPLKKGDWVRSVPKAEVFLLNLALSEREWLEKLDKSGIHEQFLSQEITHIFARALSVYRQNPSDFDKLTALLATEVEPPNVVTRHLDKTWSETAGENASKLFKDCVLKVKEAFLKREQKKLSEKMLLAGSEERKEHLEQFMNIQKSIQALHKEMTNDY